MDPAAPTPLTPNDILALWTWILLMGLATALSIGNARKNAGFPLARVWYTMAALCGYWFICAVIGLFGGPFTLLYRIGILLGAIAIAILYFRGDFRNER